MIARSGRPPAREVVLELEDATLPGSLALPPGARGVIVFAHGSGSTRHSPRNRAVAATLQAAGFGTLLFDLLSEDEDAADPSARFDIPRLATRLQQAIAWLARESDAGSLPVGLFGASTGAAAALVAAAALPERVAAVVSRGGRPDLAMDALPDVRAPTLLIVGGRDTEVLGLNRQALARLRCPKALEVVPGATHLFEETGALDRVAALAAGWFRDRPRGGGSDGAGRASGRPGDVDGS